MKQSLIAAQHCILSAAALNASNPVGCCTWHMEAAPEMSMLPVPGEGDRRAVEVFVFLVNAPLTSPFASLKFIALLKHVASFKFIIQAQN